MPLFIKTFTLSSCPCKGGWVGRKGGAVMKTSLMVKITQSDLSPWNAGRPLLPVAWLPGVTRVITPSLGLSFICTILQIKSSLTILCHKRWVITAGEKENITIKYLPLLSYIIMHFYPFYFFFGVFEYTLNTIIK